MRILGIDPGSNITGFGVLDIEGKKQTFVSCGHLNLKGEFPDRIKQLSNKLTDVVKTYRPDIVSLEKVFVHKNADSALKLGQARGAILSVIVLNDIPVFEYTPREIKQTVVGYGGADKAQVQLMIKLLFKLEKIPQVDASDAVAIALTHANNLNFAGHNLNSPSIVAKKRKGSSWRKQTHLLGR